MNVRPPLSRLAMAILMAFAAGASGCAHRWAPHTPALDAKFGDAVRAARAQQTLDPMASRNATVPTGIDGEAGKNSIDRYQESFKEPPPSFTIFGIGSGTATSVR